MTNTVKRPKAAAVPRTPPTIEKYELIKSKNKELTQKNKILINDLNRMKKRLLQVSKEKSILLDKLLLLQQSEPIIKEEEQVEKEKEKEEEEEEGEEEEMTILSPNTTTPSTNTLLIPAEDNHKRDTSQADEIVHSSRPKRMRREPVESKLRRVQPLEKISNGQYKLPARVGIITVHSLGKVLPIPTYHNDRYIWPPGFKISRTYLSMVNPSANTAYTCSVEENGDQGPKFRVIAEDCPENPITANSATGVWTAIVKSANEIRNREHSNSASGPDYYGFTHATIAKMIQDLPNADQCENYVWQKFDVMHQRTAAGVAAAAQKKISNLEIMGSANKKPSKADLLHAAANNASASRHHSYQNHGNNGYSSFQGVVAEDSHTQPHPQPQPQPQQKYYKKSSLYQIMNTPDELESSSSPSAKWNNISSNYNYV